MEHFIEAVRQHPCLWDSASPDYKDQERKDAAWAELAKHTRLASVKEAKLKWKKLRDSYRDALKRASEGRARDGGARHVWRYMAPMRFLQPHMSVRLRPRRAPPEPQPEPEPEPEPAPEPAAPDAASCSGSESPRGPPPEAARQLERLWRALPDPLDIFFNSMCQTTKRFPYHTQIRIKRALFAAVIEAEEALAAEQRGVAALWPRAPSPCSDPDDCKPPAASPWSQ